MRRSEIDHSDGFHGRPEPDMGAVGQLERGQGLLSDVRIGQTLTDPEWDRFVEATPGGTYQQTSMWAQVKSMAGWRPVRIGLPADDAILAGCQVLVRRVSRLGTIGYVPHGPLVADGGGAALFAVLDAVLELARQE